LRIKMENDIPNSTAIISSTISGILHILVGHPLDTIKTFQQGNKKITSFHPSILFRGLPYPLMQNSISNTVTFSTNNFYKKLFHNDAFSNVLTGATTSFIMTPFDKYKIMKQFNHPYKLSIKNIILSYKSYPVVFSREGPAIFCYFTAYKKLREYQVPIFLSGSLAGSLSWLLTYPVDTVKTRIQNGTCHTVKEAIQKGNLCKGLSTCLARAFIVNGINFYTYEFMIQKLMNN